MVCSLLSEWCVATSFYQRAANHVFFCLLFNLRKLLYLIIQQVMGHTDFSTAMDIYTHITQENMQEKAKNISVNMKLM